MVKKRIRGKGSVRTPSSVTGIDRNPFRMAIILAMLSRRAQVVVIAFSLFHL